MDHLHTSCPKAWTPGPGCSKELLKITQGRKVKPGQSCLVGIKNDPARFQHCFWGRGVFVVASAFKS